MRRLPPPAVLTAKLTANFADNGGRLRTSVDWLDPFLIYSGRARPPVDVKTAVFKTVFGAVLRRLGWVRSASIPGSAVMTVKMAATLMGSKNLPFCAWHTRDEKT